MGFNSGFKGFNLSLSISRGREDVNVCFTRVYLREGGKLDFIKNANQNLISS